MRILEPETRPQIKRQQRVTITDVSDALGLTKGTVSRALNNYPDIAEHTRRRVQKAAQRLGYQPLSQAQAIKTGRTRSIGLVVQIGEHDGHRPFLADFLAGISFAASAENWTLTVATADCEESTRDTINRLLSERKADGFILPRTAWQDSRIALLRQAHVPFVLFGRTGNPTDCAWFDILSEDAMQDAVARLSALGHRRIAFVNGGDGYTYARLRLAGYLKGLAEAGIEQDDTLIASNIMCSEDGATVAAQMLASDNPPTAFVYALDNAALGLYGVAAANGLRIGRDISVISYDGVPEGAFADPPLATYSVDNRQAGERLAHLLMRRIRGEAADMLRETAAATFMDRGSAGPPNLSSNELAQAMKARQTN